MSGRAGCGPSCGCEAGVPAPRREREHWRSLEQLAGTEEARAFLEREFPVGASEIDPIDRRSFVQLLGATLSLAGLAACRRPVEKIVPFVQPPEEVLPGIPKRYATTLPLGLGGYGLLVTSHEGRPTKIEGNELHPATRGSASAQMQAAILGLYDPDRSLLWAYAVTIKQWRLMYQLGAARKRAGHRPMPVRELLTRIRQHKRSRSGSALSD